MNKPVSRRKGGQPSSALNVPSVKAPRRTTYILGVNVVTPVVRFFEEHLIKMLLLFDAEAAKTTAKSSLGAGAVYHVVSQSVCRLVWILDRFAETNQQKIIPNLKMTTLDISS